MRLVHINNFLWDKQWISRYLGTWHGVLAGVDGWRRRGPSSTIPGAVFSLAPEPDSFSKYDSKKKSVLTGMHHCLSIFMSMWETEDKNFSIQAIGSCDTFIMPKFVICSRTNYDHCSLNILHIMRFSGSYAMRDPRTRNWMAVRISISMNQLSVSIDLSTVYLSCSQSTVITFYFDNVDRTVHMSIFI